MLKSLTTTLARLLLAALIAVLAWYGVYRLTTPQPHHVCIAGLMNIWGISRGIEKLSPKHYRFDSTGWWFAVGPSRNQEVLSTITWTVHHIKTGQLRELEWDDCLDPESWVPLDQGYRHTRRTVEGGIEIVDTSFVDGTSVVRRSFSKGTVADGRVFFSRDGKVAVTTHRFPLVKLLALGAAPGLNCAESMLWLTQNSSRTIPSISGSIEVIGFNDTEEVTEPLHEACLRLARFWDIDSGKLTRTFLLPAFTTSDSLLLSPDGKHLVRLETRVQNFSSPSPLGFHFYDVVSGNIKHTKSTTHDISVYRYGYINEVGVAAWDMSLLNGRATNTGSFLNPPDPLESHPFFTFPNCDHITKSHGLHSTYYELALPVRNADGVDVALIDHQNKVAIAKVEFDAQAVKVLSKPIEIPQGEKVALIPISVPGQVMVTWSPEVNNQEWYDFAAKWNIDLAKYLAKRMKVSAAIVDVQSGSVVWKSSIQLPEGFHELSFDSNISCRPLQSGNIPGFNTNWNRQAIVACYAVGNDLHLYRWELPLVSWSPAWSIGTGVLAFLVLLWVTRKRLPKYATTPTASCEPVCLAV